MKKLNVIIEKFKLSIEKIKLDIKGIDKKKKVECFLKSILIILIIGFIVLLIKNINKDENYNLLQEAIEKTNNVASYSVTIRSASEVVRNNSTNRVNIAGILDMKKDFSKVQFKLKTDGASESNPDENFNISTIIFSDGKGVYEKLGSEIKEADIKLSEFKDICSGYKLFDFKKSEIENSKVTISNEENGVSTMTFYLKDTDNIIKNHEKQYEEILNKKINSKNIEAKNIQVIYIIKDGYVISQNIKISTEYKDEEDQLSYNTLSEVSFINYEDGYDFSIPQVEK